MRTATYNLVNISACLLSRNKKKVEGKSYSYIKSTSTFLITNIHRLVLNKCSKKN